MVPIPILNSFLGIGDGLAIFGIQTWPRDVTRLRFHIDVARIHENSGNVRMLLRLLRENKRRHGQHQQRDCPISPHELTSVRRPQRKRTPQRFHNCCIPKPLCRVASFLSKCHIARNRQGHMIADRSKMARTTLHRPLYWVFASSRAPQAFQVTRLRSAANDSFRCSSAKGFMSNREL